MIAPGETSTSGHPSAPSDPVQGLFERDLRPRVQAHGGDMQLVVDARGVGTVTFRGGCRGCPALPVTFFGLVRKQLLAAGELVDVVCEQVTVSPHARRRLETL